MTIDTQKPVRRANMTKKDKCEIKVHGKKGIGSDISVLMVTLK